MQYAVLDLRTATPEDLARWCAAAEPERRERWQRFRREENRSQSICADHLVREMLTAAGCRQIRIHTGENGKPYAPGCPEFSLSHSGPFVCCAVHDGPVGIDLEQRRTLRPALARRVCTGEELRFLHPGGVFDSTRFLQLWTAKEAYAKFTGQGLGLDFQTLEAADSQGIRATICARPLFQQTTPDYVLSIVS